MLADASILELELRGAVAAADRVKCAHCGLPVPCGLVEDDAAEQFCCAGCRSVYEVIKLNGLDRYYLLRAASGESGRQARQSGRAYTDFDDEAFHRLHVRATNNSPAAVELFLPTVHCAACVWMVERLPTLVPGVLSVRLDVRRGLAQFVWDPVHTRLSTIAQALDRLGYPSHPARSAKAREAQKLEDRRHLVRIGVAGACAGNVMLMALALYAGAFSGMDDEFRELMRWLSMSLSVLALAWPGSVFFRGAWVALRSRAIHLDVPIALGLGAGGVWGVITTIAGTGDVYFDSLSVLVFALLVGRWVQRRQQRWAADSVELLYCLTPSSARVVVKGDTGESVRETPIEGIRAGDVVEVRAGETAPIDGIVISGRSAVDQSLLTGEASPVRVASGDRIAAGSVNRESPLRIRVEACGQETRIGRLMRLVEESSSRRAPIVRLADRLAGWFTLIMLLLAVLTAAIWTWLEPVHAVERAVALLIVTCPCALGLATPLAMTVAIGRAAKHGMLIKGGDALQAIAGSGVLLLDKTGTITSGRTHLVWWREQQLVAPLVMALERASSHHVARALVAGLKDLDAVEDPRLKADDVQQVEGMGIQGSVGRHRIVVGSSAYVRACCPPPAEWVNAAERDAVDAGLAPVMAAIDGRISGVGAVGDPIRTEAQGVINHLQRLGWRVGILSGDHPEIVASVGRALGLSAAAVRGGATPEQKLAVIEGLKANGPVVMVGDGVNDACALAAATVGIAVRGGSEASLAAADIYLGESGLSGVTDLVCAARRTMRLIRRMLAVSLAYNGLAAALAVTGMINPLIAAVLMPLSSLTVVALSFRSRTFDRPSIDSGFSAVRNRLLGSSTNHPQRSRTERANRPGRELVLPPMDRGMDQRSQHSIQWATPAGVPTLRATGSEVLPCR